MKILIQTYGSAGDVHPFIGIGQALQRRGHRVLLWGNGYFRETVERAGIEFRESGTAEEYLAAVNHPDLWHPRRGLELILTKGVLPDLAGTIRGMREEIEEGDSVLVASTLGFAARVLRDLVSVPLVTTHLAPAAFRSVHRPPRYPGMLCEPWTPRWLLRLQYRAADWLIDRYIGPGLNRYRTELGLAPVRRVFDRWLHSPDMVLGLFPDWFAPPQPDWMENACLTGFPLFDESTRHEMDPALDDWLGSGEPPLVFTAGSANRQAGRFFAESAKASARLGRRALFLSRDEEITSAKYDGAVRAAPYVPFSMVLPRAAAMISHAGIGTCAQALAAGTPHLAVPFAYDQFDNGSRLKDLGVGDVLPAARYRADRAAARLSRLLESPRTATRAAAISDRMALEDPVAMACGMIEELGR